MTSIQSVLYGGNINEIYVETRISIYKNQKTKNSTTLPPHPNPDSQIIFRAHYQCYFLAHSL